MKLTKIILQEKGLLRKTTRRSVLPQCNTVLFLTFSKPRSKRQFPLRRGRETKVSPRFVDRSHRQRRNRCLRPPSTEAQSIGRLKTTILMMTKKRIRRRSWRRNHLHGRRYRRISRKIGTWYTWRWCTSCFRTIINRKRSIASLSLTL